MKEYAVLENIKTKDYHTFYLEGVVVNTGTLLYTPGKNLEEIINIRCVAYPNKFNIISYNQGDTTISKGTKFYKVD